MVDYHYIKRGNKTYGPYYYRSYRVGNKVKKEYLGKDYAEKLQRAENIQSGGAGKSLIPFFILLLCLSGMFFLITYYGGITGKAAVELDTTIFLASEPIYGNLNLILKQGELIPSKTDVIVQVSGQEYSQTKDMKLKKLVKESDVDTEKESGDFYVENTAVSGKGNGYGVEGTKTIYPVVYFTLDIISIEETGTELFEQVDGSIIAGQNFTHKISNESELIEASAEFSGKGSKNIYYYDEKGKKKGLDEEDMNIEIVSNRVTVTTGFSYSVEGFGSDFISENTTILTLNLSVLELVVEEEGSYEMNITLLYEDTEILQLSAAINIVPSNFTWNHEPYMIQAIPNQTLHANTNKSINLLDYFADSDEDALSFNSTDADNIGIIIQNETAFIVPQINWIGAREMKFIASDGDKENESNSVLIEVTNTPPVLSMAIDDMNITKNDALTINLSWYFADADLDALIFSSTQPENITVSILGEMAKLTPYEDFSGEREIIFYASDGINTTASNLVRISVSVLQVNHAPILVQAIPNRTISMNGYALINLSEYFFDADNNKLEYRVHESSEAGNLNITIQDSVAMIVPDAGFEGNRSIVFTASDFAFTTQSNRVGIFVKELEVNHAPYLAKQIEDINLNKSSSLTLDLSEYFFDADNDALNFSSTEPENISMTILSRFAFIIPDYDFVGLREIIFYASDSFNTTPSNLVRINITEPFNITNATIMNHAPVLVMDIPDQYIKYGGNKTIDLSFYFMDDDNDTLAFYSSQPESLDIAIKDSLATIIPAPDWIGKRNLTFYASDGINTTASNVITIDVDFNHAPLLVAPLPDITIRENEEYVFDLDVFFTDPDNDKLDFTSTEAENIFVNITGSIARIVPDKNFTGARTIVFSASDMTGTIEGNVMQIEVKFINVTETLTQFRAVVNEPVAWTKRIVMDEPENVTVNLPIDATNISIKKIIIEENKTLEVQASLVTLTGAAIRIGGKEEKNFVEGLANLLRRAGSFVTGYAVAEEIISALLEEEIQNLRDAGYTEIQIKLWENATEYEITYQTPGPVTTERAISDYKFQVVVSSGIHYKDITSYLSMPEVVPVAKSGGIRLYWVSNETNMIVINRTEIRQREIFNETTNQTEIVNETVVIEEKISETLKVPVNFISHDTDADGLIDRIEWQVPELSEQEYEASISIINVQSYPVLYGNWTVNFDTVGEADLEITAWDGTTWHNVNEICNTTTNESCDLKFLELKCGNTLLDAQWIQNSADGSNNSVFYSNYSCGETGSEVSNVLTGGAHLIRFRFGDDIVSAKNFVKNLDCVVSTSCGVGYLPIFHMAELNNSHAQFTNLTGFPYKVCCQNATAPINKSCTGNYDTILRFAKENNSHVEMSNNSNFNYSLCLGTSDENFTVHCEYAPTCSENYTCLASINQETNSHVANCSVYSTQVCCALRPNTPPVITLASPADNAVSSANVTFTYDAVSNLTISNCSLFHNITGTWTLNETNSTVQNGTSTEFMVTYGKDGGGFIWNIRCTDEQSRSSWGSTSNKTVNINIWYQENASFEYNSPPVLTFVSPTESNNTNATRTWIAANVTSDQNTLNITFLLYNSTGEVNKTNVTDQLRFVNWTGLSSGTYYYNVSAWDSASQGFTETRTIVLDTDNPLIEYISPTKINHTNTSQNWVAVNVSLTEPNFANITFNIFDSTNTIVNTTNFTTQVLYINWTGLSDGVYYYNVTVGDTFSNKNSTGTRKITIDSTAPIVNLTSPADNAVIGTTSVNFTFNVTESLGLINCSLYHNITSWGIILTNVTPQTGSNSFNITGLSDGTVFMWNVECRDIAQNAGWGNASNYTLTINTWYSENVSFKIDRPPVITWTVPAELNTSFFNLTGNFTQNITMTDYELKELNCTIYSDAARTSEVWAVSLNITGNTTYTKTSYVNITDWDPGTYYEECKVTDIAVPG